MGSRVLLLKGGFCSSAMRHSFHANYYKSSFNYFGFPKVVTVQYNKIRSSSSTTTIQSSLPPPDVARLAETARISLTSNEVEEFAPKIQQVIDWFGQLQGVDLQSIEPSIRADTENNNVRDDVPETFDHRDNIVAAIPSYEEPYIKVPKVLNTE
ncbi:glutamyl-tRNA(Gln) amidotransferase subunit C, chloroplastic/mitochondrial-like [Senna tora]|uniref:Glutamyl-tRNA(Gln) amidotransferase subunit C, chloroplastic/mitochondrial n=1 Tax=Senna tora TaxID=362788 RepID=A0A834TF12_9FABA|nr:glutamyl-tRNA(Gln) amidotransferase subunit C, chloroplastic/mitochondrial-like [Senna tora]